VLGLYQSLKYSTGGIEKFASVFFEALTSRNRDAAEIFEDSFQGADWRRTEIVRKILDFMVIFAQDSTPTLATTFTTAPLVDRAKEYSFHGITANMFESFVESWCDGLRSAVPPEDLSDNGIDAWRYLLNLCVSQLTLTMAPRRPKSDSKSSGDGAAVGRRQQLVKTPTVNGNLRERASSLTSATGPPAHLTRKSTPSFVSASSPPPDSESLSNSRRGSSAPRMEAAPPSDSFSDDGSPKKKSKGKL
jgi:hypothetical protein